MSTVADPAERAAPVPTSTGDGRVLGVPYRWVAMGVVLFGTFMVVLDTTVVNVALPALQRDFETLEGIEWVVTAYLASVGVAQMCSGWIADRFGRKAGFVFALVLFTSASVVCATSASLGMLIAARVLQGVGGGLMLPVGMAMIYELFAPHERGRALSYFGIAVMAAPAVGPVVGGALVSSFGWRWLFLINVPIGIVGTIVAVRLLRDTGFRAARPLDRIGLALSGIGLTTLLVGFSRGQAWGWSSPVVLGLLGAGVVLLALFARHATRAAHPLLELRILRNPVFAVGMAVAALATVAQFTRLVYIPIELGTVRGISEVRIGLTMLPGALGIAITMPIGGRLVDRIGARLPTSIGMAVLGASFVALAGLTTETSLAVIAAILFVGGLGAGLAMMAPNIVAMNSIASHDVAHGSALSQVVRQISAAIGIAVLASVFAATGSSGGAGAGESLEAYRVVFLAAAGILLVVVVVAQFLPGKAKALALQQDRREELDAVARAEPAPVAELV